MEQFKLLDDVSNAEYHAKHPVEEHHFSSSQLKDAVTSGIEFYNKQIKDVEKAEVPDGLQKAYDTGTYYHTAILEPHLLDEECAVYDGKVRSGAKWQAFKEANGHKAILTQGDHKKAMNLVRGTEKNDLSKLIYSGGQAETSLFVTYHVNVDGVYLKTPKKWMKLLLTGWASMPKSFEPEDTIEVRVKVRCDYRRESLGYIADLKSTSGDPKDDKAVQEKIKKFGYMFSAILYMDAFNAELLYRGETAKYTDFIWTFATKDYEMADNYFISANQKKIGRAKVIKALMNVAEGIRTDWSFASKPRARLVPENVWEFNEWCPNEKMVTGIEELQSPLMNILIHALGEDVPEEEEDGLDALGPECDEDDGLDALGGTEEENEDDGMDCL